jgi:magnesium transporter
MPTSTRVVETEQLSIFLGKGFVITFQERPGDCFEGIRQRLRDGRPQIRTGGADYLVYSILDALVDAYFPLLELVGTQLDELETRIHEHPVNRNIQELHSVKRDLVTLRRLLWPLRELNSTLLRPEYPFLSEQTRLFMRDAYGHSVHALDVVDSYRDIAAGLVDLYLSMVSQRMNEIMKVLTIITTLFIPLSFIAGIDGMNFDPDASPWNMPELRWRWGYPATLGIMLLSAVGMLLYFRRKGWFK